MLLFYQKIQNVRMELMNETNRLIEEGKEVVKKRLLIALKLFVSATIFLSACTNPEHETEQNTMEGFVAKVDGRVVLVVSGFKGNIKEMTEEEIITKAYQSAYFTFNEAVVNIKQGDQVKVWYDAIDKSLPASGSGTKIELIDK